MHSIILTQNTAQLLRDGSVVDQQYLSSRLPVRRGKGLFADFKAVATPSGLIILYMNVGAEWMVVYSFEDSEAKFLGTQFSVSASMVRNFTRISTCDA